MPTLRLVFCLTLGQAVALSRSVSYLLGLTVPDHSTLSWPGQAFEGRQPRALASSNPKYLVVDSTGLELVGQGKRDAERHGWARRQWRKLHLAVDASIGEIAAHVLTEGHADDAAQGPALLGQVKGVIASVTADGAYGCQPTYAAAAAQQRHSPPDVVVPPGVLAVPDADDGGDGARSPCDHHIQLMAERGRMGGKRTTRCGRRNQAETAMT